MVILTPLIALMIVLGWNPTPVLERMEPSVRAVIERVESANAQASALDDAAIEFAGGPELDFIDTADEGDAAIDPDPTPTGAEAGNSADAGA
jgi:hypothetical protein